MPTLAPPWGPCCYLDYHIGWYWEKLSHWVTLGRSWLVISKKTPLIMSGMFSENLPFSLSSFKLSVPFFAIKQVATRCCWFWRDWIICVISGTWNWFLVLSPGREERGGRDQSNFVHTAVKCAVMQCSDVLYRLQIFYSYLAVLYERNTNCDPKISFTCNSVTHVHPKCILIHLVFPKSCCL